MLYLVATPIGNLADFSFRAVETLKACDYILCEDTRHSKLLLQHYQIHKPLKSFHAYNEAQKLQEVVADLKQGAKIALISDAGTPLLADPGFGLVRRCKEENIPLSVIPGPNAALTALLLSGFPPLPFQCVGFLPKKQNELFNALAPLLLYKGTSICYESPHRLVHVLSVIQKIEPNRPLCVVREMTKLHEECSVASATELLAQFSNQAARGEITLLISPAPEQPIYEEFSINELVSHLQNHFHLPLNEAIKLASQLHGIPKKKVYATIHRTHIEK